MMASNINAKPSNNNNTNPKLWINDFMILNFHLLEYVSLQRYSIIVCIKGQHLNSLIFIEFAWKAKRFPFAGFLHFLLILHHFSENSEDKNILQTIEQLMQFSKLLP